MGRWLIEFRGILHGTSWCIFRCQFYRLCRAEIATKLYHDRRLDSQLGSRVDIQERLATLCKRSRTISTNTVYHSSQSALTHKFAINHMVSYFYSPYIRNCAAGAANSNQSGDRFGDVADLTWPDLCFRRTWAKRVGIGNSETRAGEKNTWKKTLYEMSASPIARQATQSQSIPSKRIIIHDPNQLPTDYSSTPGGTLYSTTPGGQCILYSVRSIFLTLFLIVQLWSNLCDFYGRKEERKNSYWDFKTSPFNSHFQFKFEQIWEKFSIGAINFRAAKKNRFFYTFIYNPRIYSPLLIISYFVSRVKHSC